jgi:competence protein ComEC
MSGWFKSAPIFIVGALFLFCCGVWSVVYAESPSAPGVLTFVVLDVGQGDALYIESPTGVQVLIDGGPGDTLLQELPSVMPALDRSLDAVVETHPDADHIGGFSELLDRYEVGSFIEPGVSKDTATAKRLEEKIDEKKIPRIIARGGMSLDLGGGARLDILYPDHAVSNLPSDKANEGGIVARLVYGESEALLMADVGAGVETHLLKFNTEALDSDILKVGHHGSRFSSSKEFVRAVSPDTAVISVGKNSYGHPTAQTLGTLKEVGATLFRTDENGTVRCISDSAVFTCEAK